MSDIISFPQKNLPIKKRYEIHNLYLICDGDIFCKIGISKNIKKRMSILQIGNPRRLEMIKSWPFYSFDEAYFIEQLVLNASVNSLGIGEWISADASAVVRLTDYILNKVKNKKKLRHTYNGIWKLISKHNKGAA